MKFSKKWRHVQNRNASRHDAIHAMSYNSFRFTTLVLFTIFVRKGYAQQSQDPSTLNGGSALAMAGDGCVALAVDRRFGSGPQVGVIKAHL
mmetsp:Transcript_19203/g.43742  ORF Transcript_19203/g.43742 Transcript_19203/m.43742 type:complete len:91 (-) Transcript_19203:85-357(-)